MKKNKKLAVLAFVLLIILGGVLGSMGMSALGWDFLKLDTSTITKMSNTFTAQEITEISATALSTDINITSGDVDEITVNYFKSEDTEFTVGVADGVLKITQKNTFDWIGEFTKGYFHNLKEAFEKIEIIIPAGTIYKYNINISSGNINASNLEASNAVLKTSSGNITATNFISGTDLTLKTSSGNIKITVNNNTVANILDAYTSSGTIRLYGGVHATKIIAYSASGGIYFNNLVADQINIKASSGDIKRTDDGVIDCVDTTIYTSSGNVTINLAGVQIDYSIKAKTRSGDSNLASQANDNAARKVDVGTASGNIRVYFEQ